MSLHGTIMVNNNPIGIWSAQRAGKAEDDFIYRCRVEYRDMTGYVRERFFFLRHNFSDGAIALTAKVMVAYDVLKEEAPHDEYTAWHIFCAEHDLNPYTDLAPYIKLKENENAADSYR